MYLSASAVAESTKGRYSFMFYLLLFSASFVTSMIASFWRNLSNGNEFCIFLIKIAKTVIHPFTGQFYS